MMILLYDKKKRCFIHKAFVDARHGNIYFLGFKGYLPDTNHN
jgi:hypothetical protein